MGRPALLLILVVAGCHWVYPHGPAGSTDTRRGDARLDVRPDDLPDGARGDRPAVDRRFTAAEGQTPDLCGDCPPTWTAVLYHDRSPNAPAIPCPAGWQPHSPAAAASGLVDGGCLPCVCSAPIGRSCKPATFRCEHDALCKSTSNCAPDTSIAADGSCVDFGCDNICSQAAVDLGGGPSGGSCAVSGGQTTPLAWSWRHDLCVPATPTGSCQSACLPPAGGFTHAGCVLKHGDQACPVGFPKKHLLHTDAVDSRKCSCGACPAPSGGSCATTVTLYPCPSCAAGPGAATLTIKAGQCLTAGSGLNCGLGPSIRSARYAGLLTAGSCAAPLATKTGSLTPTGPMTICCP